ncbi:MAG: hypothetical protein COA91_07765 [Robiginitomaculum sp.]|nr:MAG: hypothetical protein COA91_07765 [Robiginitomaculum sp.]
MFSKLILISIIGTGALGTGALGTGMIDTNTTSRIAPSGFEFAAGPVRIESGNGKFLQAHMAEHSPLSLTIKLQNGGQLRVKF